MKNLVYREKLKTLSNSPRVWLVTGCAGFIGSNLVEGLLNLNQKVVGLDDFSTGKAANLEDVQNSVGPELWKNFDFYEGSTVDLDVCMQTCRNVDFVLHQAALGSIPRSISDPLSSHQSNVNGQLNILLAAKEREVKNVVYASSSSVYGSNQQLPKREAEIGEQLSPYAVTKYVNELYGKVFHRTYGLKATGIRYFNVFGKRQDPESIYAAVIPRWVKAILQNQPLKIFGDGETSRDFCYVENVIQMNILAAITEADSLSGEVINCACNDSTSLNDLLALIKSELKELSIPFEDSEPEYCDFRKGDIRHSKADISKAKQHLGYAPEYLLKEGLKVAMPWYAEYFKSH